MKVFNIGKWIQESKVITRFLSSTGSDSETIELVAGEYPVTMSLSSMPVAEGIYVPEYIFFNIDAIRISGTIYNTFGGVAYNSRELPAGEKVLYNVQNYAYYIQSNVRNGNLVLNDEYKDLANYESMVEWARAKNLKCA